MGKSDFLQKALPKFSVGQNLILNIIKLLEMSTSFFFQHLIMKLNSGHVIPPLFSFTLWPMRFHSILIKSHTAWNRHASHFLSDTGFMEQYGWKICKPQVFAHLQPPRRNVWAVEGNISSQTSLFIHAISLVSGTQSEQHRCVKAHPKPHSYINWWTGIEFKPLPLPLGGLCNQQNGLAQSAANWINI